MPPEETKTQFDDAARRLLVISSDLEKLLPHLSRADIFALKSIRTDLAWAIENCTVIGLHQIGKALDDHMGTGR